MADADNNGSLTVIRGALQVSDGKGTLTLPSSHPLKREDLARIDAEEGLNATLTEELGTMARRSRSLYDYLFMAGGVAGVLLILTLLLPMRHFFRSGHVQAAPSFAATIDDAATTRFVIGGLSQAEQTLDGAKKLLEARRYAESVEYCRQALEKLGADKTAHRSWSKVWSVYFDTLLALGRRAEMQKGFQTLQEIDPDLDVLAYFRGRYWLAEIEDLSSRGPLTREQRTGLVSTLQDYAKGCRFRAKGKEGVAAHFGRLLAEVDLVRWILKDRPMDADGLALFGSVIESLRGLPESAEGVRLELRAWEEYRHVTYFWHASKRLARRICGEIATTTWVEKRMDALRARLGALGKR